jgi:hypothetical protein
MFLRTQAHSQTSPSTSRSVAVRFGSVMAELLGWGLALAGAAMMAGVASVLCVLFWLDRQRRPH